jgi:hypothetical protein
MKNPTTGIGIALSIFALASVAMAQNSGRSGATVLSTDSAITGNGAPSGAHYDLNIIGVDNPKKPPMVGNDGHTIFVALGSWKSQTTVETDIWLTPGPFQVCDANGFDPAFKCDGTQIGRGLNGAVFQLPCDTAVPTDYGCVTGDGAPASASYQVWGRALGQPKGGAVITTCAYDLVTGLPVCSTENTLDVFSRGKGKSTFQDVTSQLTTLQDVCFDVVDPVTGDVSQVCGDVSLFNPVLEDYFWKYQNTGLRLAQIRFYLNQ